MQHIDTSNCDLSPTFKHLIKPLKIIFSKIIIIILELISLYASNKILINFITIKL